MTTSTQIRNRYDRATAHMSAWVIMQGATAVGRLVVTGKATASGHCYRAFFHLYGNPMVEGVAKGGGYDMVSAAISSALRLAWPAMAVSQRARMDGLIDKLESSNLDNWQPSGERGHYRFMRAI